MPEQEQKPVEQDDKKILVFITTETENEAKKIANALLTQKKAACINIISRVNSNFWWQGKVEHSLESLLIVKSREALLSDLAAVVRKNHSYQVPEILAIPVIGGNEDCLKWIDQATTLPKTT